MKKSFFVLCALLSLTGQVQAGETFAMDVETIKSQALQQTHQKIQDPFTLLDIDNNGKLSRRECSGTDDAYQYIPWFSDEEKADLKQKINDAFDQFDQDKDEYLNQEETEHYISYIEQLALKMQITKMDANNDGEITEDEMTSLMQSMPSIDESMAKLTEMTDKLQEINNNPQEYTQQMISNTASAINREESSEMDRNKDNKITPDEYINYNLNHPDNQDLNFTAKDYKDIFDLIDSQHKGYITEQEYLEHNNRQLNDVLSQTSENKEI